MSDPQISTVQVLADMPPVTDQEDLPLWMIELRLHRDNYQSQDCGNWENEWPCTDLRLCIMADLFDELEKHADKLPDGVLYEWVRLKEST